MEKRKEKSRDAARCRRSKETEIFSDLASVLPVAPSVVSHLDKASIIRVVISYMKLRNILQSSFPKLVKKVKKENSDSVRFPVTNTIFLNALEGFLLIVSLEGDIIFVSENVSHHLGLSQTELLGQSIYDFSHPCDHSEMREALSAKMNPRTDKKTIFLRMKCTLTGKGRNVNIKSASYKVIQYSGHLVSINGESGMIRTETKSVDNGDGIEKEKQSSLEQSYYFIAVGEPITHPADMQMPMAKNTFLSKHSLDMKFTYADEKIGEFFGYQPDSLIKKSLYDYHHAQDSLIIKKSFKNLFQKGQSQTGRYRFLASGGGYAWVLTQATLMYGNKGSKPNSVVCINFVISGIENKDEIYSLCQLEDAKMINQLADTEKPVVIVEKEKENARSVQKPLPPQLNTLKVEIGIKRKILGEMPKLFELGVDEKTLPLYYVPKIKQPPGAVTDPKAASKVENFTKLNTKPYYYFKDKINIEERKKDEDETKKIHLDQLSSDNDGAPQRPKPATVDVFVPLTNDMSKGFLTFASDEADGATTLKEDPDDLTHLAPTAGDVCVPLDGPDCTLSCYTLPVGSGMLDDVIFDDQILSDNVAPSPSSTASTFSSLAPEQDMLTSKLGGLSNVSEELETGKDDKKQLPVGYLGDGFMEFGLTGEEDTRDLSFEACYLSPPMESEENFLPLINNDLMWGAASLNTPNWTSSPTGPGSCDVTLSPEMSGDACLAKMLQAEGKEKSGKSGMFETGFPEAVMHDGYSNGAPTNSGGIMLTDEKRILSRVKRESAIGMDKTKWDEGKPASVIVGSKRSFPEMSETEEDTWKRSRQQTKAQPQQKKYFGNKVVGRIDEKMKMENDDTGTRAGSGGESEGIDSCARQQTDSVLMNLLVSGRDLNSGYDRNRIEIENGKIYERTQKPNAGAETDSSYKAKMKVKSAFLLEPESTQIPSLMDLTEQDYAVNAPSDGCLLQGGELLRALECGGSLIL